MVSGILQWNLFNVFQDKSKRQLAEIEKQKIQTTLLETKRLILLQAQESNYNLRVAAKARITAEDRLTAARASFNLVSKKYQQGLGSHIEFIDARNAMTSAEYSNIISKYDYFIRSAEMERVAGLWEFEKN
jgi:outer membrane protein TolC